MARNVQLSGPDKALLPFRVPLLSMVEVRLKTMETTDNAAYHFCMGIPHDSIHAGF